MSNPINIAIFASGKGSNAKNIINYFNTSPKVKIRVLVTNREGNPLLTDVEQEGVEALYLSKEFLQDGKRVTHFLRERKIDYLILAGYLLLIPQEVTENYSDKIINIHPALLPKYGGKGMYGERVHKAVLAAKEQNSGITIHLVNEEYDKGEILFQSSIPVDNDESVESLTAKIHQLEWHHFPKVIEHYISTKERL